MKGWIALDIDGTITGDKYSIPKNVADYLAEVSKDGWKVALATGRAFVFASPLLKMLDFPYILLAQNGSLALSMPDQEILFKSYLPSKAVPVIESIYRGLDTDFLIYSGFENRDRCYFRPGRLSEEDLAYVKEIEKREGETWIPVEQFAIHESFPLIKCIGRLSLMKKVEAKLLDAGMFQVSLIRDPFIRGYHILLVTDVETSKGLSLEKLFAKEGRGSLVVAAGDDENDISLLQIADVKIAMPHAPESLRKIAHFIAPPVSEQGIIQALKIVMNHARDARA